MRPVRKADNLPPCAVVTKSGNPNFLEPSGPLQACNGTALPFSSNSSSSSSSSSSSNRGSSIVVVMEEETYRMKFLPPLPPKVYEIP